MSKMYMCDKCGKPTPNFVPWTHGLVAGTLGYSICGNCCNVVDVTYTSKRRIEDMPEGWTSSDD